MSQKRKMFRDTFQFILDYIMIQFLFDLISFVDIFHGSCLTNYPLCSVINVKGYNFLMLPFSEGNSIKLFNCNTTLDGHYIRYWKKCVYELELGIKFKT